MLVIVALCYRAIGSSEVVGIYDQREALDLGLILTSSHLYESDSTTNQLNMSTNSMPSPRIPGPTLH